MKKYLGHQALLLAHTAQSVISEPSGLGAIQMSWTEQFGGNRKYRGVP